MPRVTFVHPDGRRETHRAGSGETVMDCALDHAVAGIRAQCGGALTCSTCHCYVRSPWLERLPPPDPEESELLAYVPERGPGSRLTCQIVLDPGLDGIVVHVPAPQAPAGGSG